MHDCRSNKNSLTGLLLAAPLAALIGVAAAAAADLAPNTYVKAPVAPAPAYDWSGFYVGANAGGAWGSFDPTTSTVYSSTGYFGPTIVPSVNAAGIQSIKPAGFTGGLEAGYNWQLNSLVLGLEGDIESFRLSGSSASSAGYSGFAPSTFTVTSNASTDWPATARGRLGIASNNMLLFATGGAAFTTLKGNFAFSDNFGSTFSVGANAAESGSLSSTKVGWTIGGGLEVGLLSNWSLKAEYLYVNFGSASVASTNLTAGGTAGALPIPTSVFTHSIDLKASIARIGVNYRFGGPVVAKY